MHRVLIFGVGQLGSRYLQGLTRCESHLEIHVCDHWPASLAQARDAWEQVLTSNNQHSITYHESIKYLPRNIDLAIVATTANVRPKVVAQVAQHAQVKYWILEKLLAQNEAGLEMLQENVSSASGVWVNTHRRIQPWYQEIKSSYSLQPPLSLDLTGKAWNLASNAIHLLDVVSWLSSESLEHIDTQELAPNWIEGKRHECAEVLGTLHARFSGGSRASLSSTAEGNPAAFSLTDKTGFEWKICERNGTAFSSNQQIKSGQMKLQSEMTGPLVDQILQSGTCELTSFKESYKTHSVLLGALLAHCRITKNAQANEVPAT